MTAHRGPTSHFLFNWEGVGMRLEANDNTDKQLFTIAFGTKCKIHACEQFLAKKLQHKAPH